MTSTHVPMSHSAVATYLRDRLQHLHASGQGYAMACCPFHADHSPSLSVTLRNGSYRCFGCGARGDLAQLWGNGWFVLPNPVYGDSLKGTIDDVYPEGTRWSPDTAPSNAPAIMNEGN